jgi:hypothetical protein
MATAVAKKLTKEIFARIIKYNKGRQIKKWAWLAAYMHVGRRRKPHHFEYITEKNVRVYEKEFEMRKDAGRYCHPSLYLASNFEAWGDNFRFKFRLFIEHALASEEGLCLEDIRYLYDPTLLQSEAKAAAEWKLMCVRHRQESRAQRGLV